MAQEVSRYRPSDDPYYESEQVITPAEAPRTAIVSPDTRKVKRVPPGQVRTKKWPVLHASTTPALKADSWSLQVEGLVEKKLVFDLAQFSHLPHVQVFADFHCVTRWSRLGNLWTGVPASIIAEAAGVLPTAKFVIVEGLDQGWTTNLPLSDFLAEDVVLADQHDGRPITLPHGGPVRLVVPRLYAWKSAKWVCCITFVSEDCPGYWEQLGYHDRGDPWSEQRFR